MSGTAIAVSPLFLRKEVYIMACNLFPNGICGGCINFVKSTDVTLCDNTLIITIPEEELTNGLQRCICIIQDIPDYTTIPNIVIEVGKDCYPVVQTVSCCLRCVPNHLYADQLRQCHGKMASRQILKVRFAIDSEQWGWCGCSPLCKSNGICPPPEPAPPEPAALKSSTKKVADKA